MIEGRNHVSVQKGKDEAMWGGKEDDIGKELRGAVEDLVNRRDSWKGRRGSECEK